MCLTFSDPGALVISCSTFVARRVTLGVEDVHAQEALGTRARWKAFGTSVL